MMQNYFKLFVLLCLTACSTSSKEDKLLQEAADVHNMALLMAEELETTLKQNTFPADSASAIRAAIEAWENDLVEVPGNEHHHNHEGHNHSHEPVHVTAEEMLQLQLELKQRIERIKKRVEAISNQNEHEND
jgi:LmbE family N-acetylglucosaminyl deacetylase